MKRKKQTTQNVLIKNYKKYFPIIIITIASIFVCLPLFIKNIDMTYDDGIQHICRIIGTYQGIKNGETKERDIIVTAEDGTKNVYKLFITNTNSKEENFIKEKD